MYNLDRYIADFLSNNKKVSAQGIGDFAVVNGQAVNGAPMVEFASNKQAYTTDELISFISEQERKNKIITGFDLEAHFNQVKQFINIGTPWIIPGFGQLQLGKTRELEFIQQVESENVLYERIKRKQASEPQVTTYETGITAAPDKSRNTGTIVLTLFIILALGAGGYYFYANQNSSAAASLIKADTAATLTDTVVSVPSSSEMNNTTTKTQPPANSNATTPATSPVLAGGATGFKFVLNKTANPVYAIKRFSQLKSYGTKVYLDSAKRDNYTLYKIYLLQDVSPSDTAKIKDSLRVYYGKPVTVESAK